MNTKKKDYIENLAEYMDINLLIVMQLLFPANDSKTFCDMTMKYPLKFINKEFQALIPQLGLKSLNGLTDRKLRNAIKENISVLERLNKTDCYRKKTLFCALKSKKIQLLESFIKKYFLGAGLDLEVHVPEDFKSEIPIFKELKSEKVFLMAKALNEKWTELSRKRTEFKNKEDSSLLYLPNPFFIPGGRFRDFYYWDTYWIIQGLLVCKMDVSALNLIKNFAYLIKKIGFIPNGSRKYYAFRTQPPYFPSMLLELYNYNPEKYKDFILEIGLEMAIKEHSFFQKHRSIELIRNNKRYSLNIYSVTTDFPRPESFKEDLETFKCQNTRSDYIIYSNLKSVAESGWDFSSRWFENEEDISTCNIKEQIPVDLNALMFKNEKIIAKFALLKNETEIFEEFNGYAKIREEAINCILWNEAENVWMDYNLESQNYKSSRFYFSNIEPLICGIKPPIPAKEIILKYHKELFSYEGGIPASGDGVVTHQQWDFPNAWAPHQNLLVEYFLSINEKEIAFHIAKRFFDSAFVGFKSYSTFFEKYNVDSLGNSGFGGEYAPQCGFGWTNGVLLRFIEIFKDELGEDVDYCESYRNILVRLSEN